MFREIVKIVNVIGLNFESNLKSMSYFKMHVKKDVYNNAGNLIVEYEAYLEKVQLRKETIIYTPYSKCLRQ